MLCGTVLMGILSYDMIPARAAECSHKFRYVTFEDEKEYQYDEDGHYVVKRTSYTCADCGDKEWEDLDRQKVGEHVMSPFVLIQETAVSDIYYSHCTFPGCPKDQFRSYPKISK